jgi:putative thioredoxin
MEPIIDPNAAPAGGPAGLIKDATAQSFVADVIEASQQVPVIVDFWATWCGPCKQLGPILEKAVTEARGAVKLVKIDIDRNPQIAQQLRIQSIPAVFAFYQGRPVDGFQGAVPESQVKAFIDRLIQASGGEAAESPVAEALEHAKALVEDGEFDAAVQLYGQIIQHEPENLSGRAGLAQALLAKNDLDGAKAALDGLTDEQLKNAEVAAVVSAVALAERAAEAGDTAPLRAAVEADPADHQARIDLAVALFATGEREEAIDQLLESFRRDRKWNEEAARKQLLQFFEAMGPTDPVTLAGRRKLSSLLFS